MNDDTLSSFVKKVDDYALEHPEVDSMTCVKKVMRENQVTKAVLLEMAIKFATSRVDSTRRVNARVIEESARQHIQRQQFHVEMQKEQEVQTAKDAALLIERLPMFIEWYNNPFIIPLVKEPERPSTRNYQSAEYQAYIKARNQVKQMNELLSDFESWLETKEDKYTWYERSIEQINKEGKDSRQFENAFANLDYGWYRVKRSFKNYENAVRLKITTELLDSVFALGDGTKVTWADATIEQHEQRIGMLMSQAAGTIDTAALHKAAISMLREANAISLKELA